MRTKGLKVEFLVPGCFYFCQQDIEVIEANYMGKIVTFPMRRVDIGNPTRDISKLPDIVTLMDRQNVQIYCGSSVVYRYSTTYVSDNHWVGDVPTRIVCPIKSL